MRPSGHGSVGSSVRRVIRPCVGSNWLSNRVQKKKGGKSIHVETSFPPPHTHTHTCTHAHTQASTPPLPPTSTPSHTHSHTPHSHPTPTPTSRTQTYRHSHQQQRTNNQNPNHQSFPKLETQNGKMPAKPLSHLLPLLPTLTLLPTPARPHTHTYYVVPPQHRGGRVGATG